MITEDRIKHMLSVARKCYSLAKEEYHLSEEGARVYFVMGLLHDIGYEFCEENSKHSEVGYDMLKILSVYPYAFINMINAIKNHGDPNNVDTDTFLNEILNKAIAVYGIEAQENLNKADLLVDAKGNNVTIEERLLDIGNRYGYDSKNYLDARKMAEIVGLL